MDAKAVEDLIEKMCAAMDVQPNRGLRYHVDANGYATSYIDDEKGHVHGPGEPEPSLDAFLYAQMRGYVHTASITPEQPELDVRRIQFARQLEILEQLNPAWAKRMEAEQQQQLAMKPFDDFRIRRREYAYELQLHQRMKAPEAQRLADEKYPRPAT